MDEKETQDRDLIVSLQEERREMAGKEEKEKEDLGAESPGTPEAKELQIQIMCVCNNRITDGKENISRKCGSSTIIENFM